MAPSRTRVGILTRIKLRWTKTNPFSRRKLRLGALRSSSSNKERTPRRDPRLRCGWERDRNARAQGRVHRAAKYYSQAIYPRLHGLMVAGSHGCLDARAR